MAERLPQDATVFIYFTGAGFNISGKDYYAGVDAESPSDSSHMVAVSEVYGHFMRKGARIFAFNQAHRPIIEGRYFGMETPMVGAIAQSHATVQGKNVYSIVSGGNQVGLYSRAISAILSDWRSNQVPITEFVWQVFYYIRRGGVNETGGGSQQTPTLPVISLMGSDARF